MSANAVFMLVYFGVWALFIGGLVLAGRRSEP